MASAITADCVVLISADAEWRVVKKVFPKAVLQKNPFGEMFLHSASGKNSMIFQGGWGKISAAASTQYVLDTFQPKLIINLGTCGGFSGMVNRGDIILVTETLVYDIVEQMTDAEEAILEYTTKLDFWFLKEPYPLKVIPGRLVSGDRDIIPSDIPMLKQKYQAVAADWESGAIAWVAVRNHTPCVILRMVSDLVDETSGEVYADYAGFQKRADDCMAILLQSLPAWLDCCADCWSPK